MTAIPLGDGREFDRIRTIAEVLGASAGALGDDTARIPAGEGTLVVSTDASIEGVHFRRTWLRCEEIGWRATASALSDLAAAASIPAGVLVAVGVPPDAAPDDLTDLMRGVGACAAQASTLVLGGDLTAAPVWSLTVTVIGRALRPMSRVGAAPGDTLWVTGALGGARAALIPWLAGEEPSLAARMAFARPQPRLGMAQWLAGQGATAMMDISDGLAGDAPHLAAASGVGLEIVLEQLPVHPAVAGVARGTGEDAAPFAAVGGEDYELLVAMPSGWNDAARCEAATGVAISRIGTVHAGHGIRFTLGGSALALEGFRHRL